MYGNVRACTGGVLVKYRSYMQTVRELYVVIRNSLHTGEGFLKCSKNKPYRPVQIILLSYSSNGREAYVEGTGAYVTYTESHT